MIETFRGTKLQFVVRETEAIQRKQNATAKLLEQLRERDRRLENVRLASELELPRPFSTGIGAIDRILGGGFPPGLNYIWGPSENELGPHLLTLNTAFTTAREGIPVIWVDITAGFPKGMVPFLAPGENLEQLPIFITTEEMYIEDLEFLLRSLVEPSLVIVDSFDALEMKERIRDVINPEDPFIEPKRARMLSRLIRNLNPLLRKSNISVIFIAGARYKKEGVAWKISGPGLNALRHFSMLGLRVNLERKVLTIEIEKQKNIPQFNIQRKVNQTSQWESYTGRIENPRAAVPLSITHPLFFSHFLNPQRKPSF